VTQQFLRYSPDVEQPDPMFETALQAAVDDVRRYISGRFERVQCKPAVRDVHAKGYGLARGEFRILRGLPREYAQGIYSKPGRHDAIVRFSNASHQTGSDELLGSVCGLGLKLFGIDGPTLVEDEPDSGTFDYAMINFPIFFAKSLEHYVLIHELELFAHPPRPHETIAVARARCHRLLHDFLTGKGKLPADQWAWDELGAFLSLAHIKPVNLLLSTYFTAGAMRHGDYVAKVRVAPVQAYADRVVWRAFDPANAPDIFRPGLVAELRERPFEFDIQVQLSVDLECMPIEDVTAPWSESLSPFVTVAKLRLPKQDIGGDDNLEKMDALSITPWRVTEDHRPLGNIQRARNEVYRQSSLLRHELNHQVRKEPKNLGDVFGYPAERHIQAA
jgi:Catalase